MAIRDWWHPLHTSVRHDQATKRDSGSGVDNICDVLLCLAGGCGSQILNILFGHVALPVDSRIIHEI